MEDEIREVLKVDGIHLPLDYLRYRDDPVKGLQEIKDYPMRPTDILITSSMKSGCHWLFEIISMLVVGEIKYATDYLNTSHIDGLESSEADKRPDPRVLHTHLHFKYLPGDKDEKEYKIVHIIRNPKDIEVSRYHYLQGKMGIPIGFPWKTAFDKFAMDPDNGLFGNCYENWKLVETQCRKRPSHVHLLYYEDLKRNFVKTIQQLSNFLEIDRSPSFFEKLEIACNIDNMRKHKADDSWMYDPHRRKMLYRKGEIGDWKNLFTVAQNERFDEMLKRQMVGSRIKFIFE